MLRKILYLLYVFQVMFEEVFQEGLTQMLSNMSIADLQEIKTSTYILFDYLKDFIHIIIMKKTIAEEKKNDLENHFVE